MIALDIEDVEGGVQLSIRQQDAYRDDFYKGECRFKASNGFLIESLSMRFGIAPRLSILHLPATPYCKYTTVTLLMNCGMNRTYIKDLKFAVKEYNETV
jgi:hypothetical protein